MAWYYMPMHSLIVATHTTASDVSCEIHGGCEIDPVTAIVTLIVAVIVIVGWLWGKK